MFLYVLQLSRNDRAYVGTVRVQESKYDDPALEALETDGLVKMVGQAELRRGIGALEDSPVTRSVALPARTL